jgi:hypothetical protein
MSNDKNLSFSTNFNQPKIILNGSQPVSVPVSAPLGLPPANASLDTLLSVATGATSLPIPARVYMQVGNILAPVYSDYPVVQDYYFLVFGKAFSLYVSFDSSFNLVIESYSVEASPFDATLYYRIYQDAKGS